MASYAAVIEVQLKNQQQLIQFNKQLKETAAYIRAINREDIFGAVDNAKNFSAALRKANNTLREASLNQSELAIAARDYVTALEQQEAAQKRINNAVKAEQNLRRFSPAARASQTTRRSPAGLLLGSQDTLVTLAGPFQGRLQRTGTRSRATGSFNPNQVTKVPDAARAAWSRLGDELNTIEKAYNTTLVNLGSGRGIEALPTKVAQGWRKVLIDFQNYQSDVARAGSRSGATSPIFGSVDRPGSRKAILANAPRQPVGGATNLIGSPAAVRRDERLLSAYNKRLNEANASIGAFTDDIDRLRQTGKVANASLKELDGALDTYTKAVRAAAANPELSATRERRNLNALVGGARRQFGQKRGLFRGSAREALFTGIQGGAFPLLFGQGAGAAAGGAFGGVLGGAIGGNAGFALSALFTTIGAQVDVLTQSLTQLGKSLDEPTAALQSLEFLGQSISKDTKAAVQFAESIGDAAGAAAILDVELRKAFGANGVKQIQALSSEQKELQKAWGTLTGELATALIPTLILVTKGLADFTKELQGLPIAFRDAFGGIIDFLAAQADDPFVKATFGGSGSGSIFEAAKSAQQYFKEIDEQIGLQSGTTETNIGQVSALQSLETAEADRRQREDAARALSRQAEDLARGRVDLERRVGDLRLEFLDQIQRKEEELARSRVELERQSAQIAIEARDQRLEGLGFNSRGVGRELVDAVRQYLRTRDEGEADLRQKEKLFQIDTQRRQLELERIKLQNTRKIDDLQRASADYQRQVEDYKLQVARYQFDAAVRAARVTEQAVQQASIGPMSQVQGSNRLGSSEAYPVTSERGPRWGRYHAGTDYGAPVGTPISTTLGGVVTDIGSEGGYGNYVEVRLENGVKAFWAHLSEVVLKEGQKFNAGTLIAKTGDTGRSTGPHLHSGDRNINEALSDPYTRLGGQVIAHSHTMESMREQASRINVPNLPTPPTFSPVNTQVASPNATLADLGAGATSVGRELFDAAKQIQGLTNSREFNQLLRVLDNDGSADLGQRKQATRELEAQFFASTGITENERAIQELTARRASQLEDQTQLYADVIERLREEGVWQTIGAEKTEEILNTVEQRLENEKLITDELIRQQKAQQAKGLQDSANRLRGEAQFTGTGISRFGFGRGRQEFESAKLRDATDELAEGFGKLGELLEKQNQAIADSQQLAGTISDAFKNAITVAIAGGDTQQVVAAAFASLGDKFLEIAFRPLEDVIARQLFELFEVDPAKLQEQAATLQLAASAQLAAKSLTATATAATQLTANITSAKASAGIGDALSAAGILFPAPLGLGRAFGGFVAPGNAYPVGENGPELFVPGESGTIVDDPFADVNAGLGGQPNLAEISSGDSGPGPVQVDYSGAVLNFNGSEYVSKEDVPRIVDQAVKQSYGYTQNRLRSRPGDRRKLGMS